MTQAITVTGQSRASCIATSTAFPAPLVTLCISYLGIIIPGDLEQAKKLPVLHFTAKDLTRLCRGTYGLACLNKQNEGESAPDEVTVPSALNLNMQKAKGERIIRVGEPKGRIGFDVSVEETSLAQALQNFQHCVNSRISEAIELRTMRQVLEKTHFVFVRYTNQEMPQLQSRGHLKYGGSIGSYYDVTVRRENILPIAAPEIDGSPELLSFTVGRLNQEGTAWRKVLSDQYRTSLIIALRDPDGYFARDYMEGTEGAKERDAFVAKYLK